MKEGVIVYIAAGSLSHIHYTCCITQDRKPRDFFLSSNANLLISGIKIRPDSSSQAFLPPLPSPPRKENKTAGIKILHNLVQMH